MSESRDQRDLLIRYLLGAASATERTIVEEQYFADDTGVDLLLRAEDELIDDYVRGALSASDRQLFESHFLCTEDRRQRLEWVKSFVEVLGQMEVGRAVSSERPLRSLAHEESVIVGSLAISPHLLTQERFDQLLNWLDSDYQKAAKKLLEIRRRLIKLFTARGVDDAEGLADETVDRVASRVAKLIETYAGDPARYFYGVARYVMMEMARQSAHEAVSSAAILNEGVASQRDACLEKCLRQLSERDRDLILQFYALDRKQKIANREKLAQSLGISSNALRIRAYRIRHTLENCVKSCLERNEEHADNT